MHKVKEIRICWEGGEWTTIDWTNASDLDEWVRQIKQAGFLPKKYAH